MAQVSIEECVKRVPNRFELVMLATGRAKALGLGAVAQVERDDDKNPVVALREIQADKLDLNAVRDDMVDKLQHFSPVKENEEDAQELKAVDAELMGETIFSDTEVSESESFQVVDEV